MREHVVSQEEEDRRHEARLGRLDVDGDLAGRLAGQPRLVARPGDLEGEVGARLAGADDEHRPGQQLGRVPVAAGVQLADPGVQLLATSGMRGWVSPPVATTTLSASSWPWSVVTTNPVPTCSTLVTPVWWRTSIS